MSTLRARVLLGTAGCLALVLAVAGWALYVLVEEAVVRQVDDALTAQIRVLGSGVTQTGEVLDLEFIELDMTQFADPAAGEFFQLWVLGELLYAFPATDEPAHVPPPDAEGLTTAWIELAEGRPGRVATYALLARPEIEDEGPDDEGPGDDLDEGFPAVAPAPLVLVLTADAESASATLATLRALLWIVGVGTLLAAGLVLVAVVRRSLRPVGALARDVASIGEESLSTRLDPSGVPGELQPVVGGVNGLLERLENAFERERAFSNDVAHELRTPLAGLRATLEVTANKDRTGVEYAEALNEAAAIAGQLQSMVERLLQLARLDGGRAAVRSDSYVLADVAVEAWEPFATQALERGLRVDLTLENGLEVSTDRELVEMILRNLYENAVSYADRGGEVRISATRADGGGVAIEVSNTGSRLSQEQAVEATRRFWRGDSARADTGLHCGLGLSLVEKAVDALDGQVELRSATEGEFAVAVKLPA